MSLRYLFEIYYVIIFSIKACDLIYLNVHSW